MIFAVEIINGGKSVGGWLFSIAGQSVLPADVTQPHHVTTCRKEHTCYPSALNTRDRFSILAVVCLYGGQIRQPVHTHTCAHTHSLAHVYMHKLPREYLGKSSSCHSSFTSMLSMRNVASAVPILCQGGRASAHAAWETVETESFSWIFGLKT